MINCFFSCIFFTEVAVKKINKKKIAVCRNARRLTWRWRGPRDVPVAGPQRSRSVQEETTPLTHFHTKNVHTSSFFSSLSPFLFVENPSRKFPDVTCHRRGELTERTKHKHDTERGKTRRTTRRFYVMGRIYSEEAAFHCCRVLGLHNGAVYTACKLRLDGAVNLSAA